MSLERAQRMHQFLQTHAKNISGSNDPQTVTNDLTNMLIRGAHVAAKGRSMGLTDSQTADMVMNQKFPL